MIILNFEEEMGLCMDTSQQGVLVKVLGKTVLWPCRELLFLPFLPLIQSKTIMMHMLVSMTRTSWEESNMLKSC